MNNHPHTPTPTSHRKVTIEHEPVELYKILKFEGMVASGGEAKMVIAEGLVQVNNKRETQKRKKIVSGDTITFDNQQLLIEISHQET